MPNINQRVDPVRKGNIPDLRRGVNETIDKVNWLMGLRVNGGQISEGGRGPIIDIPTAAGVGPQPWATDPDGNAAAWKLATFIDTSTGNYFDGWIWAGGTKNVRPVPWIADTNGSQAGWLIGAQGELWGTGSYPLGGAPYQQVKFTLNTPDYSSPTTWTGNVIKTPIVPPSSPPALFLEVKDSPNALFGSGPVLPMWMPSLSGPLSPGPPISFSYQITYDGTVIFTASGSANFSTPKIYFPLNQTGWQFDPAGLSGYTQGEHGWIYLYNGAVSSNTNPTIVETFTYTASAIVDIYIVPVTLYTG